MKILDCPPKKPNNPKNNILFSIPSLPINLLSFLKSIISISFLSNQWNLKLCCHFSSLLSLLQVYTIIHSNPIHHQFLPHFLSKYFLVLFFPLQSSLLECLSSSSSLKNRPALRLIFFHETFLWQVYRDLLAS